MKKIIYISVLALAGLFSCKKEQILPNTPASHEKAGMAGNNFTLTSIDGSNDSDGTGIVDPDDRAKGIGGSKSKIAK